MVELLPRGLREHQIFSRLLTWLAEGRSASSFYNEIKGTALGIRAKDFYAIARRAREAVEFSRRLAELSPSEVPLRREMPRWPFSAPPEARYRARYKISYRDAEGRAQTAYRDIHFRRLHSMEEYASFGKEELSYEFEEQGFEIEGIELEFLWAIE